MIVDERRKRGDGGGRATSPNNRLSMRSWFKSVHSAAVIVAWLYHRKFIYMVTYVSVVI